MPSLKIDLNAGVLEAEGTEEFLRELLAEFRSFSAGRVSAPRQPPSAAAPRDDRSNTDEDDKQTRKTTRRTRRKAASTPEKAAQGPANYSPSVKKSLNLSGLKEFIEPYDLKTHPEKILAFAIFLKEKMGIDPLEADDVFTAYRFAQIKPAGAFLQSIRDTSHKKSWIDYQSPTDIRVTPLGETHFLHDLPQKAS